MTAITAPLPLFFDDDGTPLDGGYVYIGTSGANPETSPVSVYWDSALTQPAAQPLRTVRGQIARSGSPSPVYVNSDYSLTVRDKRKALLLYEPTAADVNIGLAISQLSTDLASTATGKGGALVGLPSNGGGTVDAALSGVIWLNGRSGADPTGTTDSAAAINAALATGKDVIGYGTFKVGSTLAYSSTQGQRLIIRGSLKPTFKGDTIRIIAFEQAADVAIDGSLQSGGSAGAAFVIGYGGANAQQASIARCRVINYVGNAVLWEQGSMVDFTSFHAQAVTGDGILCTSNYDDNNHGNFCNTHMISCSGTGYNIPSNGTFGSALNSRSHVFTNAKAFGCGRNFDIDTINNVGSVFSELGTNPDRFGVNAAGNEICLIETVTSFANWLDNSTAGINSLRGYSTYNQMEHRKLVAQSLLVQNQAEGRQSLKQTGARAWSDTIEATTGIAVVTHSKGTASKRTDVFDDRVQFNGGLIISTGKSGTITPTLGALASGAVTTQTVAAATSGAGVGDTAIATLGMGGTSGQVQVSCNVEASGDLTIVIQNAGASSVTLGAVTIRWVVLKHVA